MPAALEGIRVLDLSRFIPGVFCTMLMADMGADVIVIEEPITSPTSKARAGPSGNQDTGERALASNPLYRNKRRMELNLKTADGLEVFYRLCKTADIVLEGFRPGVVQQLGVDYETAREINPRIVYCSITGYGQTGPYEKLPGHDINYLAIAGTSSLIGLPDGPLVIPQNLIGDYAGGSLYALSGMLMALVARQSTGRGQYVDIAMADGVASLMTPILGGYFGSGRVPKRGEGLLTGAYACYAYYETKDGKHLALGCAEAWFHANLCRVMGREDFIPDQYNDARQGELFAHFRKMFLTKTRDEWFDILSAQDVCVSKVNTVDEVAQDPQLLHRGMITSLRSPGGIEVRHVGIPFKLSDTPGALVSTAPARGAHTREVLRELGYWESGIEGLRKAGVF